MTLQTAPCNWPVEPSCCPSWATADPALKTRVTAVATEILWALSGRRFGVCPVTVRPCRKPCERTAMPLFGPYYGAGAYTPTMINGAWINGCGKCVVDCACGPMCEVALPGPVDSVIEVKLDGAVVPAAEYFVYDHRTLVRRETDACWPDCQDLSEPDTEPNTFSVTYGLGVPVPEAGLYAAEVYACELLKACTDGPCRLPRRVTSVTRQGVTWALLDPMEFLDDGLTGLYEVDAWIKAVNPAGIQRGARVYSPDRRPPRRQTWP